MIRKINGTIGSTEDGITEVSVPGGITYGVQFPSSPEESPVEVHIEEIFLDGTGTKLYGFVSREERRRFNLLRKIQGVGARVSLAVLQELGNDFERVMQDGDVKRVSATRGVGAKTAQRIVLDIGAKLVKMEQSAAPKKKALTPPQKEAKAALMKLGMSATDATEKVLEHNLADASSIITAVYKSSGA